MAKGKKKMETDAKDRMNPKSSFEKMREIWGVQCGKYKTTDICDYEESLKGMNLADLQKESVRVGRIPRNRDRKKIVDTLLREFQNFSNGVKASTKQPIKLKVSDEAKQVLALGGNHLVY